MKILISNYFISGLFALTLLSSHVGWAWELSWDPTCEECVFGFMEPNYYSDPFWLQMELGHFKNSLICPMINANPQFKDHPEWERNDCPRFISFDNVREKYPKTLHQIIDEEMDAPIHLIDTLALKSESYWKSFDPSLVSGQDEDGTEDFNTFRELNLTAAKLWQQLVNCNQGSSSLARQNLYTQRIEEICVEKTKSQELHGRLVELAQNFQTFLSLSNKKRTYFLMPERLFINVHPLLVQYLFFIWSGVFNEMAGDQLGAVQPLSRDQLNELNFTDETFQLAELQNTKIESNFERHNYHEVQKAILFMLTHLTAEKVNHPCSIYGLWPALNQFLITDHSPINSVHRYQTELFWAAQTVKKNCGYDFANGKVYDVQNGVYGRYFVAIINNHRLLYRKYFFRSEE